MPSLPIDLNRARLHDVAVPASFEVQGHFEVELRNHGEAVHVHLHLDDELSRIAALDDVNHYVAAGDALSVPVAVRRIDEGVTGRLKVVTGYGAETAHVALTIQPGAPRKSRVEVDESLAKPPKRERPQSDGFAVNLPVSLSTLGLVLLAFVVLVVVGLVVDPGALYLAAGIVIGGAVVALYTRDGVPRE